MANSHIIYKGGGYDLGSEYGKPITHASASSIGTAINAQTANQLNAVSQGLNSGIKTIEVQMTMPDVSKAIPNQHLDEINRLRKLTGAQLTLHGPMVEPTGFDGQSGTWTAGNRERNEARMWEDIERGHRINPDGNINVTLHASTGLPEPETKIKTTDENGKKIEKTTQIGFVNVETGQMNFLPVRREKDYLTGNEFSPEKLLEEHNERIWSGGLSETGIELSRARNILNGVSKLSKEHENKDFFKAVQNFEKLTPEQKEDYGKKTSYNEINSKETMERLMEDIKTGHIYIRDAMSRFKEQFNQAYTVANDSEKDKLDNFSKQWVNTIKSSMSENGKIEDYSKLNEVANVVSQGIDILGTMKAPEVYKPLKDFAMDKASETFSNLAWKGYKKFKSKAPILSLENHPAGPTSGFYRAKDMKDLIEETRKKFIKRAVKNGIDEDKAKKEAEKLVGATWDVGHINLIRQFGYDKSDLKKEFKTIAPYVKHVHLSDNFGFEHSELPMGMGNVPMKEYEKLLKQYGKKTDEIKRIVEAGDWISQFGGNNPMPQTLAHFGSPIYAMEMAPSWNQAYGTSTGGYYSGLGNTFPDVHFSQLYGSGFQNLPTDLGGQMSGQNRMSGNPLT